MIDLYVYMYVCIYIYIYVYVYVRIYVPIKHGDFPCRYVESAVGKSIDLCNRHGAEASASKPPRTSKNLYDFHQALGDGYQTKDKLFWCELQRTRVLTQNHIYIYICIYHIIMITRFSSCTCSTDFGKFKPHWFRKAAQQVPCPNIKFNEHNVVIMILFLYYAKPFLFSGSTLVFRNTTDVYNYFRPKLGLRSNEG